MNTVLAICHECDLTFQIDNRRTSDTPRCVRCQSEFVEYIYESNESEVSPDRNRSVRNPRRGQGSGRQELFVFPEEGVSVRVGAGHDHADNVFEEAFRLLGPFGRSERFNGAFAAQSNQYGGALERLVDQLSQLHQPTRTPAASAVVQNLKRERIKKQNHRLIGESCAICHEEYEVSDHVITLPCGHAFHTDCVMPWFNDHNTCPVCRYALPTGPETTPTDPHSSQVVQEPSQEEPTQNHSIDSIFGLSRASSNARHQDVVRPRMLSRRTYHNPSFVEDPLNHHNNINSQPFPESESERHIRNSILNAQSQLRSLDSSLSEQLEEHRRLQDQIEELQLQRQMLRDRFTNFQNQGMETVSRFESFVRRRSSDPNQHSEATTTISRMNQVADRLRNIINRGPNGLDNSSPYSSSNSSSHSTR